MRSEAAAQVLNCRQAVDDPKQPLGEPMTRPIVVLSFLTSLLLAVQAYAVDEVSEIDVCRGFSLIAKSVMTARQARKPMSETLPYTMKLIENWAEKHGIELDSKEVEEGASVLVIPAYETTTFPKGSLWNEDRQDAINEFENGAFEHYYEGLKSD